MAAGKSIALAPPLGRPHLLDFEGYAEVFPTLGRACSRLIPGCSRDNTLCRWRGAAKLRLWN